MNRFFSGIVAVIFVLGAIGAASGSAQDRGVSKENAVGGAAGNAVEGKAVAQSAPAVNGSEVSDRAGTASAETKTEALRQSRLEKKADRTFIRGSHAKAMEINRRAEERLPEGSIEQKRLQRKMARLYTLLQRYDEAIECYDKVLGSAADTLLSVEDVCMYIDNLRLVGDFQRAESVARVFAFKNKYSRNQRYMNILYGLTSKQHYYGRGDADYMVRLYENSTSEPEYWVGSFEGEAFYAVSHSPLQDPLKVFYYRTQYLTYSDNRREVDRLRAIPRELQTGPVAFSPDGSMMVATGIDYSFNDQVRSLDQLRGLFPTQLFYSVIDAGRNGWGAFQPLFDYQEGYSYAHPAFTADGGSVIYSSDCPGGFGGMDLYICHWNDGERKWSEPVNLGKHVNTEGDEIYPLVWGNRLYFSSNGLEGFGGYDIYNIVLRGGAVLAGSISHYPYPVNTSGNDFGLRLDGGEVAYFVSDRRGLVGRDDIYTFNPSANSLSSDFSIGVSQQHSALTGNLGLINGMKGTNTLTADKVLFERPADGELLLSVYFDFDKHAISAEYREKLDGLLADRGANMLDAVAVVGYADELGGDNYNQRLSERRANAVADYLERGEFRPQMMVEGRGRQTLSPEERFDAMQAQGLGSVANPETGRYLSIVDRIRINSRLRRVDIYAKDLR
ncbi:MAG: OmpA family protein [Alistipes sp.]|jgi:tetratricopeptide (TPR) repeat protein|nr:OmpA family protein [Alistipes sp.]